MSYQLFQHKPIYVKYNYLFDKFDASNDDKTRNLCKEAILTLFINDITLIRLTSKEIYELAYSIWVIKKTPIPEVKALCNEANPRPGSRAFVEHHTNMQIFLDQNIDTNHSYTDDDNNYDDYGKEKEEEEEEEDQYTVTKKIMWLVVPFTFVGIGHWLLKKYT
jgi:hypothetical protein